MLLWLTKWEQLVQKMKGEGNLGENVQGLWKFMTLCQDNRAYTQWTSRWQASIHPDNWWVGAHKTQVSGERNNPESCQFFKDIMLRVQVQIPKMKEGRQRHQPGYMRNYLVSSKKSNTEGEDYNRLIRLSLEQQTAQPIGTKGQISVRYNHQGTENVARSSLPEKRMGKERVNLPFRRKKKLLDRCCQKTSFSVFVFVSPASFQCKGQIQACIYSQWGETWSLLQDKLDQERILNALNHFQKQSLLPLALSRGSHEPLWFNRSLWELRILWPRWM